MYVFIQTYFYNLPDSDFLNWRPLVFSSKTDILSFNYFLFLANILHLCLIVYDDHLHIRKIGTFA